MRRFLDGLVQARRLQLPDEHPWLDVGRAFVAAKAAEEAIPIEFDESGRPYRFPKTDWSDRLDCFPSRDPHADFCVTSGYELFHTRGCPPFAIVVRAYKVERMGSWKACQDYWLGVFPDGKSLTSGTLTDAVRRLWRIREAELAAAKALREDMEALDDL